ncbi:hypothetical protein AMS68_007006 [Peltaster fructicola]|uniref:NAD-dependent epimerase/dehydratase domain-containing protein n=1 Tax=Peltaster fructicola TaxID=286661 RepID=A0A6H0Y3R3_9PEZI|nr:hypothetical protein AMS68_007006 [Peltaster fructicola]
MTDKALAPGSLILVTGINGYLGGHVAAELLKLGYSIRGTARDQAKADLAVKGLKKYGSHVEGVVLSDHTSENAYHSVLNGIDGVVHVASDVSFGVDPNVVVTGTVNAMNSILTAAAKESTVKRFVYTSSVIAAAHQGGEVLEKRVINDQSWNTNDVELAWAPNPSSISVYAASKVESEKALWKFAQEHKGFEVNTVLPSLVIGPPAFAGQNLSTSGWLNALYSGPDEQTLGLLKSLQPALTVDVRDIARAHVAALLDTDVVGQRIVASTESGNITTWLNAMKKAFPEHKTWAAGNEVEPVDKTEVDNAPFRKLIKRQGRSDLLFAEESLRDQIAAI